MKLNIENLKAKIKILLITTYFLTLIDLATTLYLVGRFGIQVEANAVAKALMSYSMPLFIIITLISVPVLLVFFYKAMTRLAGDWDTAYVIFTIGAIVVFAVSFYACVNNLFWVTLILRLGL